MAETSRAQQLAKLRDHCTRSSHAVLFDEPGGLLLDVASGRTLLLDLPGLSSLDERRDRDTGRAYLLLVYGDGRRLALSEAGIAFPPDTRNTGALPDLPEAVCLRDYRGLLERLKHELYGHPDREPDRNTVRLLMMCIAVLDGARAAGFDVGREERELESHLRELERRAPAPRP